VSGQNLAEENAPEDDNGGGHDDEAVPHKVLGGCEPQLPIDPGFLWDFWYPAARSTEIKGRKLTTAVLLVLGAHRGWKSLRDAGFLSTSRDTAFLRAF
jgi:hypothetical protein